MGNKHLGEDIEFTEAYLRKLFAQKVGNVQPIEKVIFYDKDCPSFEISNFSICPPEKLHGLKCSACGLEVEASNTSNCLRCNEANSMKRHQWTVLAWTHTQGDRETPPDAFETEIGQFDFFQGALECVWLAMSCDEIEAMQSRLSYDTDLYTKEEIEEVSF